MPTWVETYLSDTHPFFYPTVFLSLFLAGSGFPISADLVLLTVGYLAYQGQAEYSILIPLCIAGILLSDTGMFCVGKYLGSRLVGVWPFRKAITPERMARAEAGFRKHGYRVVFLARFMPGIRTVFMFTSGVLGLRYWKFIVHDLSGALIVVPGTIFSVKWAAGNQEQILSLLRRGQWFVLGGVVLVVIYLVFFKKRSSRRKRSKESSGTRSDPASLRN